MRSTFRLPDELYNQFISKSDGLVINTIIVSLISLWVAGKVDISEEYNKEFSKTKDGQRLRGMRLKLGLDTASRK